MPKSLKILNHCFTLFLNLLLSIRNNFCSSLTKIEGAIVAGRLDTYYLLHKIDIFYVNVNNREITFDVDGTQMESTTTSNRFLNLCGWNFAMDTNAFDYCKKVLNLSISNESK